MHWILFAISDIDISGLPKVDANQGAIDTILTIVWQVTGSIALLLVVIGGLRYITAQGDPNGVSQAKKTIIYALVGLMVSILAFAIVKLVVDRVG